MKEIAVKNQWKLIQYLNITTFNKTVNRKIRKNEIKDRKKTVYTFESKDSYWLGKPLCQNASKTSSTNGKNHNLLPKFKKWPRLLVDKLAGGLATVGLVGVMEGTRCKLIYPSSTHKPNEDHPLALDTVNILRKTNRSCRSSDGVYRPDNRGEASPVTERLENGGKTGRRGEREEEEALSIFHVHISAVYITDEWALNKWLVSLHCLST